MLNWMKRFTSGARTSPAAGLEPAKRPGRAMSGKYLPLYEYLGNRYADTVVLTFAEVEDLVGFALPDGARVSRSWWVDGDPSVARPAYTDSWILAGRTAKPNLLAQTVVFERPS